MKFGVVGTAHWASEVHVPGLLRASEAQVVGVFGRSPDKTEALARRYAIKAFASFDELLAQVDAVSIAVPPMAQRTYAVAAANAGKHVILEKPIAANLADAMEIANAIRQNDVRSLVFFIRRFVPGLREALAEAKERSWERAAVVVRSAALAPGSPYHESAWRHELGAALWDIGPHVLSILIEVMGPVRSGKLHGRSPSVRFSTVHESGATADISLTLDAAPQDASSEYRFFGQGVEMALPELVFSRLDVFTAAAEDFIRSVNSSKRHPLDVEFGLETVRVLELIERSASAE
jgi:predicted dehydrogenase